MSDENKTLRDEFAIAALNGRGRLFSDYKVAAAEAYICADEMMRIRLATPESLAKISAERNLFSVATSATTPIADVEGQRKKPGPKPKEESDEGR